MTTGDISAMVDCLDWPDTQLAEELKHIAKINCASLAEACLIDSVAVTREIKDGLPTLGFEIRCVDPNPRPFSSRLFTRDLWVVAPSTVNGTTRRVDGKNND